MDNNNTVYFQEAKKQLGDVINSGEYELLPDYKSLWYWFVEEASKNTKESLLEVQFGPTQVSSLHCNFGINVTDESLGGKMYHRSAISHKDYLSYQDDDVRKQCFLTEYTITGTDTRRYFEPEYKGFSGKGEGKWPSSAPGNMKFYDRTKSCYETGGSKANLIAIRYSDILLNYAEVENYLNGTLEGGSQLLGLKENAFGVVYITTDKENYRNTDIITDEVIAAGKEAADKIISGELVIEVPEEAAH